MKKLLFLFAVLLGTVGAWAQTSQKYYKPGPRTLTLEAGKKYFISVATYYGGACTNLLYNNNGTLAKSNLLPNVITFESSYIFTVEEVGDGYLAYIKNSSDKYIQADNLASTETKTGVYVIPYFTGKAVCCGDDVDACDANGNQILYNDITAETPIVTVQKNADYTNANNRNGWRYIDGLSAGVNWCTAFAFYEAEEVESPMELTTDTSKPILYTIKNLNGGAYVAYDGASHSMRMSPLVENASFMFYFTQGTTPGTFKIHNYVTDKKCEDYNSWTEDGRDWYIKPSGCTSRIGLAIAKQEQLTDGDTQNEAWNNYRGESKEVASYGGNDAGSVWDIAKFEGEIPTLQFSTEENITLNYIRSIRRDSYVNFDGHNSTFKEASLGLFSYWYFIKDEAEQENAPKGFVACRIFNAAHGTAVANFASGYMEDETNQAKVFYIGLHEASNNNGEGYGYIIRLKDDPNNGWHDMTGTHIISYSLGDRGSHWRIYPADKTPDNLKSEAATNKTNALNTIAEYEYADYYAYSEEAIATAKAAINALETETLDDAVNSLRSIANAMAALEGSAKKKDAPVAGDYIQLRNRGEKKYLTGGAEKATNTLNKGLLSTVWVVEAGENGNVKLKNASTGRYIGTFGDRQESPMVADAAQAAKLSWTNQEKVYAVFKNVENNTDKAYGHVNGGNLTGWTATATNSQWIVSKVDMDAPTLTNLAQLSEDKVYTLRSQRAQLYYNDASKISSSNSVAYDRNATAQQFQFKSHEGKYYLYSVGAQKYINNDGTYVDEVSDAAAVTMHDVSGTYPEYPWKMQLGSNYLNSQSGGGLVINSHSTTDAGNSYKIEVGNIYSVHILGEGVENATVTIKDATYQDGDIFVKTADIAKSDIIPTAIDGKITVINLEGGDIYVSYIDETTQFYTIKGGHGGYMSLAEGYVDADKNLCLDVKSRIKDKQGLWTFVEQEGGGYKIYNYSTGWSKAVGMTTDAGSARARMLAPDAAHTAFDGNINFDGTTSHIKLKGSDHNYWNRNGNYRYLSLWNDNRATNNDEGSMFFITAVDFNNFVDVAKPVIPEVREELDPGKIQGVASFTPDNANTLWYRTSAMATGVSDAWMEYALPLGNGELGCMVYGGVLKEEIQFNEKTLWNGPANKLNVGSGNRTFMNFGSLFIKNMDESIIENGVTDYVRYLDIEEGVAGVEFTANGTKQVRKYFSSAPDGVIAGQYKIEEGDGKLNLRFTLEAETEIDADNVIYKEGMASFTGYMESVNYAARVHVVAKDGDIETTDEGIVVENATEVIFYLKGATNFDGNMDVIDRYFTDDTPYQINDNVKSAIEQVAEKDFAVIENEHREDFKELTGKMTFSLGLTCPTKDTKELVDYYYPNNGNGNSKDNDHLFLEQLYFHYGRYLAISSNRKPIAAPNNLQGIWNNRASGSPWNSDIHTNINIQMNYWPTEITNLSDLHKPFVNYIIRGAQTEGWKNVSKQYNNNGPGWGVLTETSLYGAMSNFKTNYLVANVWYTSHLWTHYRYTQDTDFLKKAFPVMWSAAEFWMHRLIKDRVVEDGTYVAPDEYSAEQDNHSSEDATAHAQQMVSYLFQNIIDAIDILGEGNVGLTPEQIADIRKYNNEIDKGLHTEIYDGAWGATFNGVKTGDVLLREWKYSPYSVGEQGHRHLSHLMALFPMDQITPESPYFTPAVNALKQRGDAATGWSMGWKVNLWARAQDGDHAHLIIKNALKHSTAYGTNAGAGGIYYNLFDSHAPFQIDGNFGVCSGMAEMLMQSAHGYINILPALPSAWETTGEVSGMKAIGNFTVGFNWQDGKVQNVTIESHKGAPLKVRCKRGVMDISKAKITVDGEEVNVTEVENGIATIPCNEGQEVVIDFTTIKTVAYTVSGGTGTFDDNNAGSKWEKVWTFNNNEGQPAALQFTTTQNNMDSEAAENNMLIAPGNSGATYTLKVPFPFLIKGYSFHCDGPDDGDQKIVIGNDEYPVQDGVDIKETDLSTQQAQFTLSGNNASVEVTNFKVYITTDPSFEYADSYANVTKWYTMKINPNDASHFKFINYTSDSNGGYPDCSTTAVPTTADASTKAYAWAFVGDLYNGFKLYNRAAGGDFALYSSGSGYTTMTAEGTVFQMVASQQSAQNGTLFSLKTPYGNYLNKGTNSNRLGHYTQNDGGSTLILSAFEEPDLVSAKETAWAEMMAKINTLGNTLGTYSYKVGNKKLYTIDALRIALRDAYTDAEITALLESYELNMPQNGQFFRIRGISGNYIDASSIYGDAQATTGQMSMKSAEECNYAGTIFYLDEENEDKHLLNYSTGTYTKQTSHIGAVGDADKAVWTFTESPRKGGKYALRNTVTSGQNGQYLHDSDGNRADRCGNNCGVRHDFTLEEVTSLPFTFNSKALGFATFCAPVNVEIPNDVTAYIAEIQGKTLKMRKFVVEDGENLILPAETPVMLNKADYLTKATIKLPVVYGEYTLSTEDDDKNDFVGTIAAEKLLTDETYNYYSLQKNASDDSKVGFYRKAEGNDKVLGGFKAWIKIEEAEDSQARTFTIIFDGDDATGLKEALGLDNENVEIYDLSGRRLDKPTKGVNIVGGKLVIK